MALGTCLLLLLKVWFSLGSEYKLSDSKLLLPYYSKAVVNYTITGTGGSCYEWWSGTNEVVAVVPLGDPGKTCTNKASVTAVWQSALRATSTIYARDQITGHVLKCDVIVDDIHSIKIDTTTQELFLHKTPESLVVIGYDEYGNTFSTLDGIAFEWKIHTGIEKKNSVKGSGVLRFLSWTESEYSTPPRIGALEAEGMQGYMQLVSGLRTGSAIVSASLKESVYRNIKPAKVRLLVMANAQLNPPVLYLMPYTSADFRIHIVRHDNDEEVSMPSRQYFLSVADMTVVELDQASGASITALSYGQTTVALLDKNVEDAIETLNSNLTDPIESETQLLAYHRRPISIVNVVEPAYFRFSLAYGENKASICMSASRLSSKSSSGQKHSGGSPRNSQWSLESLKIYVVSLDIYDQDNHRLFPSDNQRIAISFSDTSAVELIKSTANGTVHLIRPLHTGPLSIKAKLFEVIDKANRSIPLEHPISGSQEVLVYSPLSLLPNKLNIAWGNETTDAGYALEPSGGSGEYLWAVFESSGSNNAYKHSTDVVTISVEGIINPLGLGSIIVVVFDLRNPDMCSQSIVQVSQASSLTFATKGRVEIFLPRNLDITESLLSSRTIAMDVEDLNPSPAQDPRQPLSLMEKHSNAILAIGLIARDTEGNIIHDCHNMALKVKPRNPSVVRILPGLFNIPPHLDKFSTNLDEKPCAFFRVVGLSEGFTELETTYEPESDHKSTTHFPIAVYRDIEFLGEDRVVYVAVGSSRRIWHINGPQPWQLDPSFHFANLNSDFKVSGTSALPSIKQTPRLNSIQGEQKDPGRYSFVISCESSGIFDMVVTLGNLPTASNSKPAVLASSVTVFCEIPTSLHLIPHLDLPFLPPHLPECPFANRSLRHSDDSIPIPNNFPVRIEVVIKGSSGHELTTIDSIATSIRLSLEDHISSIVADSTLELFHTHSSSETDYLERVSPYFFVTPRTPGVSVGDVNVQVIAEHQWPGEPSVLLESTLSLSLSPPVRIESSGNFQLLYHPKAVSDLHLIHGSGFFHLDLLPITGDADSSACVSLKPDTSTVERLVRRNYWLTPRCRGKATVKVTDLCFPATAANQSGPATDNRVVSVVDLASLRLYAPTQIELNSKAIGYARAFDTDGNVLPTKFATLLDLKVVSSAPSVDAACDSDTDFWLTATKEDTNRPGIASFSLCGHALGSSKLKITSSIENLLSEIHSNVVSVNVFAPLRLEPCNFNLLKGAAYQLTASGGPFPRSLEFSVTADRPELLKTFTSGDENSVLIRAVAISGVGGGTVHVNAKSISDNGYADLNFTDFKFWNLSLPLQNLHSETTCQVNIVSLSGIRIGCPLPETTASTLGSAKKPSGQRVLVALRPEETTANNGVPIWAEGVAASSAGIGSTLVTPMGLSDLQPPLHFSWRLTPPMPNAPAKLVHWLNHLNVEPDDTSLSSGLVLVGLNAGQMKLQLSVFTDNKALSGQLIDEGGRGKPVAELSAELLITIVPYLSLLSPFRQNPKLLVSPNSQLQIRLPVPITSDHTVQYSVDCMKNKTGSSLVQISTSGLLQTARGSCDVWSSWQLEKCRCRLQVSYGPSTFHSRRTSQSLSLDVVIKPPLYLLARATAVEGGTNGFSLAKSAGLPFGGPYQIALSFHDEMGDIFDAVTEELLSFHVETHRNNLLDYSVTGNFPKMNLNLRLVPPLHMLDRTELQQATTMHFHIPTKPSSQGLEVEEEGVGFTSSYLSVPTGALLNIGGDSSDFIVGQWTCLPNQSQGAGQWSSSDPSVAWIDAKSAFILPLRPGRAHLVYTFASPTTDSGKSAPMSLLGRINVVIGSTFNGVEIGVKLTTKAVQETSKELLVMPVGLDTEQEIALQIKLTSAGNVKSSHCVESASPAMLRQLSELAPFSCSVRLEHGDAPIYLPSWLRTLLLAEDYSSSILVPSNVLAFHPMPSTVSSSYFSTQLLPSTHESGAWTCVVRTPKSTDSYLSLAGLQRSSRVVVDVKRTDEAASTVVATSSLRLVPGFRVIAPPMHFAGYHDMLLLTRKQNKGNLLIFIPPATLAAMETSQTQLKARSQRPDILTIDAAPRPLFTPEIVQATLKRIADSSALDNHRRDLLTNISRLLENEAQVNAEQAMGNGLIWILSVRSIPTKIAVDVVVEVVLGLKTTNQHISVPIRVQTSSISSGANDDVEQDSDDRYWPILSWFHLFLLAFLTCMLLLAAQLVIRSTVASNPIGGPYSPQKHGLPPINQQPSIPALWSQGLSSSHQSPMGRARQFSSYSNMPNSTLSPQFSPPVQPIYGGYGDTPRFRAGNSSPSRLREAFDNSL